MTEDWQRWISYLGKRVKVTLDRDDPSAFMVGTLVTLEDSGEVSVRLEDGFRGWGWPCLEMELEP